MSESTMAAAHASTTSPRTRTRIGTWALWAGGAALLGWTSVLAFKRGGYQADDQELALAWLAAALALCAVAVPWPLMRRGPGLVALAGLAGLAGWTALSLRWARIEVVAADDTNRLCLYVAAFALGLVVMREPLVRRLAPWSLLVGAAAASVYGLATRLVPKVAPAEVFGNAGARLSHPITYWNAMGLLAGCGVLLGIACAAERGPPRALRALACVLAVPCAMACYMTLSRGAFVAVLAGLVVLALMRPRRATALAAACVLVPGAGLAVALQGFPAVRLLKSGTAKQVSQGHVLTAIAVAAALAAGAAFLLLHRDRFDRGGWKPPFRLGAALAVGSVLAILVGAVAISYFSEQSEELPTTASRLADVTTFRGPYWRIALQAFANHPVDGIGSGSFRVEWLRKTKVPRGAVDAHSLYFETLGELGLVGGVLLLIFLVSVGVGSVRAARAGPRDAVLPACFAVMAAWTVHVGVDWDWELPGVTLPALVLAAAALAASPRPAADLDSEA